MLTLESQVQAVIRPVVDLYRLSEPPAVSVAAVDISGKQIVSIDADKPHVAASTMKLAVMLEIFRLCEAGKVNLDSLCKIENSFTSAVDGMTKFTIVPEDDSDYELFAFAGTQVSVRFLIERMITLSSNLATNMLFELIDRHQLARSLHSIDVEGVTVPRAIEDFAAADRDLRNIVTASGLNTLLLRIANHTAASPASCESMLAVMSRQRWNDEIPSLLPPGVVVAHKTGWLERAQHDAAIIFPPSRPPFMLTVLTSHIRDHHVARRLVQLIGRTVYDGHVGPAE